MEGEIKSWLKNIIKENIDDHLLEVLGNTEKGDGYMSDILFAILTPSKSKQGTVYKLVLKCSKRSEALRATTPVKQTFMTEIFLYEKVIPVFTKFQLEKGIRDPFNSIPKCYGTFIAEDMEMIVLENLKMSGYTLWDKTKPLTKKHLNLIVEEYAKFHSVSVAMNEQNPQKFEELTSGLGDTFKDLVKAIDAKTLFGRTIIEIYDLLKGDLDEKTLDSWKTLHGQINFILDGMVDQKHGLKVIVHGDCWSNNFMFKYSADEIEPVDVSILDWQISRASSPILDLSYFIFACISNEDVGYVHDILNHYYEKLKFYSSQLGTNLDKLYSRKQFLDEWKKYAKFGVLLGSLIYKVCATEKDEVMDVGHVAEDGKDFVEAFSYEVKNKTVFKNRARDIIKYVVENELI